MIVPFERARRARADRDADIARSKALHPSGRAVEVTAVPDAPAGMATADEASGRTGAAGRLARHLVLLEGRAS